MDLEIVGRHALFFDDDAAAAAVNSGETLVPWAADSALLMDRFDARHLLDRVPPRPPPREPNSLSAQLAESDEIDRERYLDLLDSDGTPDDTNGSRATVESTYSAVPFSYGNTGGAPDVNSSDLYHPTFPLPESLSIKRPPSEKVHQIIAKTALFVSKHGGQSEIVLRVKQGDNPTFAFLMPDNHLHGYFRYLVDNPHLLESGADIAESNAEKSSGGALSLLGAVYGSGEDDENIIESPDETSVRNVSAVSRLEKQTKENSDISTTKDKEERMQATIPTVVKENSVAVRKNQTLAGAINGVTKEKSKDSSSALLAANDKTQRSTARRNEACDVILEPPSLTKLMMEKIIEFVLRNGKEFEVVLIEQDKNNGRFPFLLPSNQYHSYYQKLLKEARELKPRGRTVDYKDKIHQSEDGRSKSRSSISKESTYDGRSVESSEKWVYDHRSKQKFKMEFGPKKDDEQASSHKGGVSANELAAIVQAATRGASPFNVPQDSGKASLKSVHAPDDLGPSSSDRTSPYRNGADASSKPPSKYDSSTTLSGSKYDSKSTVDDVWIAKTIAKTAALVASREADPSEANLTREQKLKAERLRRAKMFAEMIKSGGSQVTKVGPSVNGIGDCSPCSDTKERSASPFPFGKEMQTTGKDGKVLGEDLTKGRGSSVAEMASARTDEKDRTTYFGGERKYRKKENVEYDDADQVDKFAAGTRHSRIPGNERRSKRRRHRHSSHHKSSSEDESVHISSEDERRHKSKRSSHRHNDLDHLSEGVDLGGHRKHRRHHS